MTNKIVRTKLITSYGDKSDLGIIYIDEILAYDENDEEILDNKFINSYNHGSEVQKILICDMKKFVLILQKI